MDTASFCVEVSSFWGEEARAVDINSSRLCAVGIGAVAVSAGGGGEREEGGAGSSSVVARWR